MESVEVDVLGVAAGEVHAGKAVSGRAPSQRLLHQVALAALAARLREETQ